MKKYKGKIIVSTDIVQETNAFLLLGVEKNSEKILGWSIYIGGPQIKVAGRFTELTGGQEIEVDLGVGKQIYRVVYVPVAIPCFAEVQK